MAYPHRDTLTIYKGGGGWVVGGGDHVAPHQICDLFELNITESKLLISVPYCPNWLLLAKED